MIRPRISVVIPSYNREKLIEATLQSIRLQTSPPDEVLVVDDCSKDTTVAVIAEYAKAWPDFPLLCLVQEKNQGVSAARNRGIREAKGDWVAFLDSDDLWTPTHLAGLIATQTAANADVVFSRVRGFSEDDPTAKEKTWTSRFASTDEVLKEMIQACHILPSAAMVRRDLLLADGFFDETPAIQHAEDWDLWLRFIEQGVKFQLCDDYSCRYRQHANSACSNKTRLYRAVLFCLHKHARFPLASAGQWQSSVYYYQCKLGRSLFEARQRGSALEFRKAWSVKLGSFTAGAASAFCAAADLLPPLRPLTLALLRRCF